MQLADPCQACEFSLCPINVTVQKLVSLKCVDGGGSSISDVVTKVASVPLADRHGEVMKILDENMGLADAACVLLFLAYLKIPGECPNYYVGFVFICVRCSGMIECSLANRMCESNSEADFDLSWFLVRGVCLS
jgi:hypothetical protein